MSEPKFDAPEIVTLHSFSDPKSPNKSAKPSVLADDVSSILKEESIVPVQTDSGSVVADEAESTESARLPTPLCEKPVPHIKITDLREARKNRGKESYILVVVSVEA